MRRPIRPLLGVMATLLLACADDALTPEMVAGTYVATQITVVTAEGTADWLEGGVTLSLTLTATGTTTGQMFLPAAYSAEGIDQLLDMVGTYSLSGATVRFSQQADTFVSDLPYTVSGSVLRGTLIRGSETLSVRLTRT